MAKDEDASGSTPSEKLPRLEVALGDIHCNNINQLRKLNEQTFPVR